MTDDQMKTIKALADRQLAATLAAGVIASRPAIVNDAGARPAAIRLYEGFLLDLKKP